MKTINYTGNSKLISRIVHLLNRKAPLPLDGDGDAVWGTNGQVLTTDGSGSTSWTTPQGGGGDVTDVEVNGVSVVDAQGVANVTVPTALADLSEDSTHRVVTDTEKTTWNDKVSDNPTFTEAGSRVNIASGESFATILGKIKKFFSDLKTVAFTGAYADLSGTPDMTNVAYKNINNNFATNQTIDRASGAAGGGEIWTQLTLGNATGRASAGHSEGEIRMYRSADESATDAYYTDLRPAKNTGNRTITLPDDSGTVALTSDLDSCVDWASNGIIGAKNHAPITLAGIKSANTVGTWSGNDYTANNVTFTVNTDSNGNVISIKANGQASSNTELRLFANQSVAFFDGMTLVGCPSGGSGSKYRLAVATYSSGSSFIKDYNDYGNGVLLSFSDDNPSILQGFGRLSVTIFSGYNAQDLMFYPMIRLSADTDATFQPYSMTNLELTNALQYSSEIVTTGAGSSIAVGFYKFGKMVCVRFSNGYYTAAANASLFLIPVGYEPVDVVDFRDTYGNKRINGGSYGREREMYCTEALTNTPIRGTFCYFCK